MEDEIKQKVVSLINEKKGELSEEFVEHEYPNTPFKIHMHDIKFNGYWSYSMYEIFKDNVSIGKLYRNYRKSKKVFQPFLIRNKWHFLFSDSYTRVSVYNESLEKINHTKTDFCPIDIYVPRFKICSITYAYYADNNEFYDTIKTDTNPFYTNFAFISGCYWGDDTSEKIRIIDLSNFENEFNDTEEYGYIETFYDLRKAIIFNKRQYPNPRNVKILIRETIKNLQLIHDT